MPKKQHTHRRRPHLRLLDMTTGRWEDWVGPAIPPLEPRRTQEPFDPATFDAPPPPALTPYPPFRPSPDWMKDDPTP